MTPSAPVPARRPDDETERSRRHRTLAAAVAMGAVAAVLTAMVSLRIGGHYGISLFLGAPSAAGFVATLIHGRRHPVRGPDLLAISLWVVLFGLLLVLVLAMDGLMCGLMAAPLAFPAAFLGSAAALPFLARRSARAASWSAFPILWLALAAEPWLTAAPELRRVTTEVEVAAPADVVWDTVVAFPPITTPPSWEFRAGIAYPVSAELDGEGVGAIRRCRFSTGDFVEPVTVWDPGRRLAFDVLENPAPMIETSFYEQLEAPHLQHTFVSERGEFVLEPTERGTIRLRGTTWYRQRLWPQVYWNAIADRLIHRIHGRVLEHIRDVAEDAG